MTSVLYETEEETTQKGRRPCDGRGKGCSYAATGQRMPGVLSRWERRGRILSWRPQKEYSPADTLILDFWPRELAERAISNEDDVDEKPVRRVFFQKGLRATLVQTSITRTIVLLLLFESPHFSHRSKVHSVNVTTEFRSFLLFSTKCSFPLWNSVIFPVQFGESHGRASSASFHTQFS
uniref:Uncharacterized protein n=1 Tax=Rousettus aegyptiacus TaxID=9407 RepID=A0A7J8C2B6_ROUAE|nr:hypothetical protein HJG63_009321 [Rousettus aegyptiacus]